MEMPYIHGGFERSAVGTSRMANGPPASLEILMKRMTFARLLLTLVAIIALVNPFGLNQFGSAGPPKAKDSKDRPTNRLAREISPYLLMHAHNPVDWYPWGPEAFAKAKKDGKLVFLSIGY